MDERIGHSFEEEWPELARRLDRFLAAKSVEVWLRGDVVQETATRVYRKWPRLDQSRPLWNLVVTIALGILIDERRKAARIELVPDPIPIHRDDVHLRGLQRAQLDKTRSALQLLTADQRGVLLAEIGEAPLPEGTRNRIKVLRLRARARLRETLGPWAPAGVALRIRSLRFAIQRRTAEWAHPGAAAATSITSVAVAATLALAGSTLGIGIPAQGSGLPVPPVIRYASLYPAFANMKHLEPPKTEAKAKDGPERKGDGPSGFVERQSGWAEAEGQRWAEQAQREKERAQDEGQRWAEQAQREKERAQDEGQRWTEQAQREKERAQDWLP